MALGPGSFLYATNSNANASATVTVPAGAAAGWQGAVLLSQGNTDVITGTPPGLTLLDNTASASTSLVERWYTFTVGDGTNGTVVAGSVLTWTLSVTRQWATYLQVAPGVASIAVLAQSSANLTTMLMPTGTTDQPEWVTEVGVGKANGATVTAWTPPTGMTVRATAASGGTFGPSIFGADGGSVLGAGVAVGGESYTPNQAISGSQRYLLAFRPAPVTLSYYVPASDTGATTTGWTKSPSGAASFAAVINDADNATYAEASGPSSLVFGPFAIPDVAVPDDKTSFAVQVDLQQVGATTTSVVVDLLQSGVVKKSATFTGITVGMATYTLALTATDLTGITATGSVYKNLGVRVTGTAA